MSINNYNLFTELNEHPDAYPTKQNIMNLGHSVNKIHRVPEYLATKPVKYFPKPQEIEPFIYIPYGQFMDFKNNNYLDNKIYKEGGMVDGMNGNSEELYKKYIIENAKKNKAMLKIVMKDYEVLNKVHNVG